MGGSGCGCMHVHVHMNMHVHMHVCACAYAAHAYTYQEALHQHPGTLVQKYVGSPPAHMLAAIIKFIARVGYNQKK